MNKTLTAIAATTMFAMMASPAMAEHGHGRGHGQGGFMMNPQMLERAAAKIGLDDNTLRLIKDKVYTAKKQSIPLKAELETTELELRRALDSDAPDRATVMKLVDSVGTLKTQLTKVKLGVMLDIKGMLTQEQIGKLKAMRHEFHGKKGKRQKKGRRERGERRGPPDGE